MSTQLLIKLQEALASEHVTCHTYVQVTEADDQYPRTATPLLRMNFNSSIAEATGLTDGAVFDMSFLGDDTLLQIDCTLHSMNPGRKVEDNFPLRLMYALSHAGIGYRIIP